MRKPALAGLLLCAIIFGAQSPEVSAEAPDILEFDTKIKTVSQLALKEVAMEQQSLPPAPEANAPVIHKVVDNETLTSIAESYNTEWKRIFDKNLSIDDPDMINPGQEIQIPLPEETLANRPWPVSVGTEVSASKESQPWKSSTAVRASSSGNGYVRGYCTWYAKNRRPDLPNNLGNADTWVSRARAQGIPTGAAPRVGAVGQQGMHVVYVESVNGDGTVTVSEMNFTGWNVVSSRTVSASTFYYIYQ